MHTHTRRAFQPPREDRNRTRARARARENGEFFLFFFKLNCKIIVDGPAAAESTPMVAAARPRLYCKTREEGPVWAGNGYNNRLRRCTSDTESHNIQGDAAF